MAFSQLGLFLVHLCSFIVNIVNIIIITYNPVTFPIIRHGNEPAACWNGKPKLVNNLWTRGRGTYSA